MFVLRKPSLTKYSSMALLKTSFKPRNSIPLKTLSVAYFQFPKDVTRTMNNKNNLQSKFYSPWNFHQSFCTHADSEDNFEDPEATIESRLIALMDKWEIEKAEKLLRQTIENGVLPNRTVVLNLLQLIGNLGDFECLLSLREILMNNKLCSNEQFFRCLQEAYYYSGRVDEAVLLLRILYHDIRNYKDIDIFFTLVGVMVLVHFPYKFDLMENFAKDCRDKEPSDFNPTAGLWKCLMLTGNFEKAKMLVSEHEETEKYIPRMVKDIVDYWNKVNVDRLHVLNYLVQNSSSFKDRLQKTIYTALIAELVEKRRWDELLSRLNECSEKQTVLVPQRVKQIMRTAENILFNDELDNFKLIQCIDKLKSFCE